MKPFSLFQHFVSTLAIFLIAHQPLCYATTSPTIEIEPSSQVTRSLTKQSKNGFTYTTTSQQDSNITSVKLTIMLPPDADQLAIARLTQHSLFYGTEKLSREKIAQQLHKLGLDINPEQHIATNEIEHSILFTILDSKEKDLETLLTLISELAFNSTINQNSVESARQNILDNNSNDEILTNQIATLTYEEIQTFYKKWYRPSVMHLSVMSSHPATIINEKIENTFGSQSELELSETDPQINTAKLLNQQLVVFNQENTTSLKDENNLFNSLNENIRFISEYNAYVVDGKIWMNEPNWFNKAINGRLLGLFLTALGIGACVLAFPIAPAVAAGLPVLLTAASLSTVTGVYFMASSYLKDPDYISKKREEDKIKGFEHAYRNGRAHATLTPMERRFMFLVEMIHYPTHLNKYPIVLLADLYDLNQPVLSELFLVEEMNFLIQSKLYFIQHRNEQRFIEEKLEQELRNLTAPYATHRDNELARVKIIYNQNPFVIQKESLKREYDRNIENIEHAYLEKQITPEDHQKLIKEHEEAYKRCLEDPYFAAGLAEAKAILEIDQQNILAQYEYHVSQCKLVMQYDLKKAQLNQWKYLLICECDIALRNGLTKFPGTLPNLPDFVDLR